MEDLCQSKGVTFHVPEFIYCTDNAAMIGCAAYPLWKEKKFAGMNLNAKASESIKNYIENSK